MKKELNEREVAENAKKNAKGCLKFVGILLAIIVALGMIGNMLPEPKKTPLEIFVKEHKLGKMKSVEEIKRGDITQINFNASRIKYGAYVYNAGDKKDEIISIWTDFMPLYSVEDNDTVLDEREQAILRSRAGFLNEINGQLKMTSVNIKQDLKKRVKFPKTFSIERVRTFDNGTFFLQEITFSAKNAFGVPIEKTAMYKVNFETNTYELQGIY